MAHRDPSGSVMYYEDHPRYGTTSVATGIVSTATPALVLDAAGEPHVLGTAADGRLLHAWRSAGAWRNEAVSSRMPSGGVVPETSNGTPAVARAADGSLLVLARQPMSVEPLVLAGGSWSHTFLPQQVFAQSGVRAVSTPKGIEAVVIDQTSRLVRLSFAPGGTTIRRTESGRVFGTPGIVVSPSGRLDVFARGADGLLWQKSIEAQDSPWVARDEVLTRVVNGSSGLCLEAIRSTASGPFDSVIATACSDRDTQRWYRRRSASSGFGMKSHVRGVDGMCLGLDVPNDFGTIGRKLALRPCNEDSDQQIDFDRPDAPGTDKLAFFNTCTGPGVSGQAPAIVQCTGDTLTEWKLAP
jgi:hypothetical protein